MVFYRFILIYILGKPKAEAKAWTEAGAWVWVGVWAQEIAKKSVRVFLPLVETFLVSSSSLIKAEV